jgi:hypothetical protein
MYATCSSINLLPPHSTCLLLQCQEGTEKPLHLASEWVEKREMVGKETWNVIGRTRDPEAGVRCFGHFLRVVEIMIHTAVPRTFWRNTTARIRPSIFQPGWTIDRRQIRNRTIHTNCETLNCFYIGDYVDNFTPVHPGNSPSGFVGLLVDRDHRASLNYQNHHMANGTPC